MRSAKARIELRRINEIEERALGIDAGDDGFSGDFFAVGEDDRSDGVIFDADVLDVGLRADFGASGTDRTRLTRW